MGQKVHPNGILRPALLRQTMELYPVCEHQRIPLTTDSDLKYVST